MIKFNLGKITASNKVRIRINNEILKMILTQQPTFEKLN